MKKRYFTENNKLFNFVNKNKNNIIQIKPIKKLKNRKYFISSYCVIYVNNV